MKFIIFIFALLLVTCTWASTWIKAHTEIIDVWFYNGEVTKFQDWEATCYVVSRASAVWIDCIK
jgi:hypothetical protein